MRGPRETMKWKRESGAAGWGSGGVQFGSVYLLALAGVVSAVEAGEFE
jgi:hypothetical protein